MSSWKRLLKTDNDVKVLEYWVSVRLIVGAENVQGGVAERIGVSTWKLKVRLSCCSR